MHVDTLRTLCNYSDVIHGTIPYNGFEELVLSTPLLLRLQRISQSSLAFLTFPSNKVKRFEHSIGVMHLASQYFRGALINTSKTDLSGFFESIRKCLDNWILSVKRNNKTEYQSAYDARLFGSNGDIILKKFTLLEKNLLSDNRFFDKYVPSNIENENYIICVSLFQGLRLAGLLHDLGHLPYSHTLESILKQLYTDLVNQSKQTDLEKEYIDLSFKYCESGQALHEELSKAMLDVVELEVAQTISKLEYDSDSQKIYALLSLVSFEIARNVLYNKDSMLYKSLHSIISGVVDADRLDYASRDLFCSAVSKDIINYDRFFLHCSINRGEETDDYSVVFDVKATHDIEEFLRKRWRIYRVINYHHSVLKSEIIMRRVLREKALDTLKNSKKVFYNNSKDCVVAEFAERLPNDFVFGIMLVLHHLAEDGDPDALRKILLMLDDSWLDTLMKRSDINNGFDNELIYGRKIYKTILKRYSDFLEFDEMVYNRLVENINHIKEKAILAQQSQGSSGVQTEQNKFVDSLEEFLEEISELDGHDHYIINYGRLFSNSLLYILELLFPIEESTRNKTPLELFESILISNDDNQRVFLGIVDFGTGIPNDEEYKLWNSKKSKFVEFTKYSSIKVDLECEKDLIPPFYLYAKIDEVETTLLEQVCNKFVDFCTGYITEYLEKCTEDSA